MQARQRRALIIVGFCVVLVLAPVMYRLSRIYLATQQTIDFCRSVSYGERIESVLERAESGAGRLVAAVEGDSKKGLAFLHQPHDHGTRFHVIFEDRKGKATWPRYLIWTGPHYRRVYCSLEQNAEGSVHAIHIGPIDEGSQSLGFFEDWFNE